jgi:hypothetical protein
VSVALLPESTVQLEPAQPEFADALEAATDPPPAGLALPVTVKPSGRRLNALTPLLLEA